MKPTILKLIRKTRDILTSLEVRMDSTPRYKIKDDSLWVKVYDTGILVSEKTKEHDLGTPRSVRIPLDSYFKIRDTIKSYQKKNETTYNDRTT